MKLTVCRWCQEDLDQNDDGTWVDADGSPTCSVDGDDDDRHVAVPMVELPTIDALADQMVELGTREGFSPTPRFRESMKGWAKLAHRALSGEKK